MRAVQGGGGGGGVVCLAEPRERSGVGGGKARSEDSVLSVVW